MRLIAELSEGDIGVKNPRRDMGAEFVLRKSARAVLFNSNNEVCLQHITKIDTFKLPGGGMEHGESIEEALRREVREEVGCELQLGEEIGVIIEYRHGFDLHISYAYIAYVQGEIGEPAYDEGEVEFGFRSEWYPLTEAIEILNTHNPEEDDILGRFIQRRETIFLQEAGKILK